MRLGAHQCHRHKTRFAHWKTLAIAGLRCAYSRYTRKPNGDAPSSMITGSFLPNELSVAVACSRTRCLTSPIALQKIRSSHLHCQEALAGLKALPGCRCIGAMSQAATRLRSQVDGANVPSRTDYLMRPDLRKYSQPARPYPRRSRPRSCKIPARYGRTRQCTPARPLGNLWDEHSRSATGVTFHRGFQLFERRAASIWRGSARVLPQADASRPRTR